MNIFVIKWKIINYYNLEYNNKEYFNNGNNDDKLFNLKKKIYIYFKIS